MCIPQFLPQWHAWLVVRLDGQSRGLAAAGVLGVSLAAGGPLDDRGRHLQIVLAKNAPRVADPPAGEVLPEVFRQHGLAGRSEVLEDLRPLGNARPLEVLVERLAQVADLANRASGIGSPVQAWGGARPGTAQPAALRVVIGAPRRPSLYRIALFSVCGNGGRASSRRRPARRGPWRRGRAQAQRQDG